MKKILLYLFVCLPWIAWGQEKIMLIADPHVMASSLTDNGVAFNEMMAGERKMLDVSQEAFTALIDTALQHKPALVLIPGDMTKDSEVASHRVVVEQLNRLRAVGIKTLVVPGNHDINGNAYAYQGADKIAVESLQHAAWESTYATVYDQAVAKDPNSHSYVAEPLAGVSVLGIDCANGTIGDNTLSWLLAQADEAHDKGNMIIAMSHWQLLEHVDNGGIVLESGRVQNADVVRNALMAHGVHLVLTGHVHVNSISTYRDTIAMTGDSIMEISTGSVITYPCPYRWLTVAKDRSRIEVQTAYLTALTGQTDLTTYSRAWMKEHTENLLPTVAIQLFDKSAKVVEDIVTEKMAGNPMGAMVVMAIKQVLSQSNEQKVALVEKHMGSTLVDLYLLHSAANEPDYTAADSLAQAAYSGMDAMMREVTDKALSSQKSLQDNLVVAVQDANKPAIQSLVEDRTHWASQYSDCTDDLQGVWVISEPKVQSAVENVTNNPSDDAIYDLLGRRVAEMQQGIYIQNGKKFIK